MTDFIDTLLDESRVSAKHNLICLPNAQSFDNTHLTEALSTYAQGWKDPEDYDGMLDFFFPQVQVPRKFEFRKGDNSEDFVVDSDDERPAGADFKTIKYSGEVEIQKTLNRGLSIFVDPDMVAGMPNWQQVYTARLLRRIKRNALSKGLALVLAAASNTGKTWSSATDPDADGMNLVKDCGDLIGFNPNRIAFTGSAWVKRCLALRAKDTAGARISLGLTTPQDAAVYYGAQMGKNVSTRVKSGSTKANITGGDYLLAFYAEDGAGPDDPSATKRFWSTCDNGAQYAVYVRPSGTKFFVLTVECYDRLAVTSTLGLKKLTIA